MAIAQQTTALIGVFADHRQAERFVEELKLAGFRDDQIGMMRRGPETADTPVGDNAVAGALTGGTLGALTGAALTTGLIPGVGPVLVGGVLLGILSGATAGAAAGGILGALIGLGIPEEEARHYESEVRAGRTLVVVQPAGRFPEALAILRHVEEAAAKPLPPSHQAPEVEHLDKLL
jgi:hypothetical protein